MKRVIVCTLLVIVLIIPPIIPLSHNNGSITSESIPKGRDLNFHALTESFGDKIPVVVRFKQPIEYIQDYLESLDIQFCFGTPDASNLGDYYLMRGSPDSLTQIAKSESILEISPQTPGEYLQSPRDESIPEIDADYVWTQLDTFGVPLTGENLLIADLDSGVDWTHPDLWFADGGTYNWLDDGDGIAENSSDAIDLDDNGLVVSTEEMRYIDLDGDGTFNTTTEWVWAESINQNGIPDIGEPFFVVNDDNHNDQLDLGETLVMLQTPKTQYIVEKIANSLTVHQRGLNLTTSAHEDTDGHGTAVAGILLGGQLGYRKYVGVAPSANLMMIKVIGAAGSYLTVEEGLTWAYQHSADAILIEIGSWTYHYLDGSSTTESLIDFLVSQGIPVIAPSGNLGGKDKHSLFSTLPDMSYIVDFSNPPVAGPPTEGEYITQDIENIYITVLSINSTDFNLCNFSIVMYMGGPFHTFYLHPGIGEWNWFAEPMFNGVLVESFISLSGRTTSMLAIRISGSIPQTNAPPWHSFNVTTQQETTFHSYISDDQSSWTGGAIWKTDVSDDYEITWPSTADSAISVASYRTRDLVFSAWNGPDAIYDIAGFSSRGPRIDETLKQTVAAPGGYDIISDWTNASIWSAWYDAFGYFSIGPRFGGYRLFSGTSASGPHVAGAVALLLQYNLSKGSEMMNIIANSARIDPFTGIVPNPIWGYGKLNVSAAYEGIVPVPDTEPPIFGIPVTDPGHPWDGIDVGINITVTDPSGVDTVMMSYMNLTGWFNTSTLYVMEDDVYIGIVPSHPTGSVIHYKFYANDSLGYMGVSEEYNYTVAVTSTTIQPTTGPISSTSGVVTSTGQTSTTTATYPHVSTTSTTTTPSTSTEPPPEEPDYITLAIMLMIILLLFIAAIAIGRRRS
jgi:hypothetical protein